jgi:hypothetical protein
MNKQAPGYDIRTAAADDIPELLALQADNQISRGGALSIEFPATWFADVIRDMPIVTAWREHRPRRVSCFELQRGNATPAAQSG